METSPSPRSTLASLRPGHIFWLPARLTWVNRDKRRPVLLLTECSPGAPGSLIYGSTQATEMQAGACALVVAPVGSGVNRNGLRQVTSFYPGILLRTGCDELPAPAGHIQAHLAQAKTALRLALGIGRGSCLKAGSPGGSRRGRIIEMEASLAVEMGSRFAVLLTEPAYSRERRYQVFVPLIRGDGKIAAPEVIRVSRQPWLRIFGGTSAWR